MVFWSELFELIAHKDKEIKEKSEKKKHNKVIFNLL